MNNIFWGYKPQPNGSYCNINIKTGMVNYQHPSDMAFPGSWRRGYPLSQVMKKYSKLDDMVKKTIDKFAKAHLDLFNKFINIA